MTTSTASLVTYKRNREQLAADWGGRQCWLVLEGTALRCTCGGMEAEIHHDKKRSQVRMTCPECCGEVFTPERGTCSECKGTGRVSVHHWSNLLVLGRRHHEIAEAGLLVGPAMIDGRRVLTELDRAGNEVARWNLVPDVWPTLEDTFRRVMDLASRAGRMGSQATYLFSDAVREIHERRLYPMMDIECDPLRPLKALERFGHDHGLALSTLRHMIRVSGQRAELPEDEQQVALEVVPFKTFKDAGSRILAMSPEEREAVYAMAPGMTAVALTQSIKGAELEDAPQGAGDEYEVTVTALVTFQRLVSGQENEPAACDEAVKRLRGLADVVGMDSIKASARRWA